MSSWTYNVPPTHTSSIHTTISFHGGITNHVKIHYLIAYPGRLNPKRSTIKLSEPYWSALEQQHNSTLVSQTNHVKTRKSHLEFLPEEILEGEAASEEHAPPWQTVPVVGEASLILAAHIYGQDVAHTPLAAHHITCTGQEEEEGGRGARRRCFTNTSTKHNN